jgi:hypothetical protein
MDQKEMTEEIVGLTDEIATSGSGKGLKVAVGIGLGALGAVVVYKRVIKPIAAKIKAKREARKIDSDIELSSE